MSRPLAFADCLLLFIVVGECWWFLCVFFFSFFLCFFVALGSS